MNKDQNPRPGLDSAKFRSLWPAQYWEDFSGYADGAKTEKTLSRLLDAVAAGGEALDIGCGRGDLSTRLIVPRFDLVTALDVWPSRPTHLAPSVVYQPVGDRDYTCSGVPDASIDFVWSFGCFCHLPNSAVQEYLHSIRRVLKPDGRALVMMANWDRHPARRLISNPEQYREVDEASWFYYDVPTARQQAEQAHLSFEDSLPDFRDTIALLQPL